MSQEIKKDSEVHLKKDSTSENFVITRNQNDFTEKLLSLQQQQKVCDVSLIVNEERIAVHSNVLAACSEFFTNVFVETGLKELILNDVDIDLLKMLINYCYSGNLDTTEKKAKEMVRMARVLSVCSFIDSFVEISKARLNINNCVSYWKLAKFENITNLETLAFGFIKNKLVEVSELQDFLDLKYSEIHELFSSDLTLPTQDIYDSLKQWINHDKKSRFGYFDDLLNFISLENLPLDDLLNDASTICDLNAKCLNKYLIAAQSQNFSNPKFFEDDTLLAINNYPTSTLENAELFDKNKQEWILLDSIKLAGNKLAVLFINGKLMMISDIHTNNAVEFQDLKTNEIDTAPSLSHKRNQSATVKFNRNAYVIGGSDMNNEAVSHVEKWDPISKSWSDVSPLITACYRSGAAVLNDEIFVVGGSTRNEIYSNITQVYVPSNDKWEMCKPMIYGRINAGVAAVGKYLYAVGGESRHFFVYIPKVEKYDPTIDQWTIIDESSIDPKASIIHSAVTSFLGQLVIAGGKNYGVEGFNEVYSYDECKNQTESCLQ